MYVCMYVYVYVCMYVCTCVCFVVVCKLRHIHVHVHMHDLSATKQRLDQLGNRGIVIDDRARVVHWRVAAVDLLLAQLEAEARPLFSTWVPFHGRQS